MCDFLIVGAGINGLLLARELLACGVSVTLVDRGKAGREASWAGGGIVSPLYPWRYAPAVTALATWAQNFYPRLVEELLETTGKDSEFSCCGLLMLDADDEQTALQWAASENKAMEQLDSVGCYRKEPGLAPGFQRGLWMPEIANVRNPRLCQSLLASLIRHKSFRLLENSEVLAMQPQSSRIESIELKVEGSGKINELHAGTFVVTAGAWSNRLLRYCGTEIDLEPVKGQMLLYKFTKAPIQSIVLYRGRYLIPRRDGHLLVGSTLEHAGFDKTTTAEAKQSLQDSALRILPQLSDCRPIDQWAGLRPGSSLGIPTIGKIPGLDNVYVSAGHHRNGLVLAPASARLLADIMVQRRPIVDPDPYKPKAAA